MDEDDAELALTVSELGIFLQVLGKRAPGPIGVDFGSAKMTHRRRGGQNELLGRAVGAGKRSPLTVLDATAGLGGDSFVLADLGCDVISLERSPLIHCLLLDGWQRGAEDGEAGVRAACARMQIQLADAIEWMRDRANPSADVVYLDPMFPERGKAARARKEMWLFQNLLGEDEDTQALLAAALNHAIFRVVVKRPIKAPSIDGPEPTFAIKGKAVRLDVYSKRKLQD
jgi:16S rRNA (guanine1516-N2)-methyltransferase